MAAGLFFYFQYSDLGRIFSQILAGEHGFEAGRIEADHNFVADNDGWSRSTVQLHELAQRDGIGLDVFVLEGHLAGFQKLLDRVAGRASGLTVEQDALHAFILMFADLYWVESPR
jgi:hypothetical protein